MFDFFVLHVQKTKWNEQQQTLTNTKSKSSTQDSCKEVLEICQVYQICASIHLQRSLFLSLAGCSAVQGEKLPVGIMALQIYRLQIAFTGVNLCWNCQASEMTSGLATKGLLSIRYDLKAWLLKQHLKDEDGQQNFIAQKKKKSCWVFMEFRNLKTEFLV